VGKEELSDRRFCEEFIEYFGGARAAKLIGFCLLWGAFGSPTMKDIAAGKGLPGLSRATVYNYFADLRRFRLDMIAKGYDRPEVTGVQAWDNAPEVLASDEALRTFVASLRTRMPSSSAA
jgi:AcrR family transcriptional regulator